MSVFVEAQTFAKNTFVGQNLLLHFQWPKYQNKINYFVHKQNISCFCNRRGCGKSCGEKCFCCANWMNHFAWKFTSFDNRVQFLFCYLLRKFRPLANVSPAVPIWENIEFCTRKCHHMWHFLPVSGKWDSPTHHFQPSLGDTKMSYIHTQNNYKS